MTSKYEYSRYEWMKHFDYFFLCPQGSSKAALLSSFGAEYQHSASEACWNPELLPVSIGQNDLLRILTELPNRAATVPPPL